MFGLIKKVFIVLLIGLTDASNHTKCISLSNQKYMIQPTLINLHPNEYSQEFHTIHFRLNQMDVLEVVIVLMINLRNYVFQIKWKI